MRRLYAVVCLQATPLNRTIDGDNAGLAMRRSLQSMRVILTADECERIVKVMEQKDS